MLLGALAAVLSIYAYFPYIIDTINGRTKPERATWLIWSVLGSISFFSQLYAGAFESLWFAGVQVSGTIAIFLLSIRNGFGKFLNNLDYIVLALAAIGLALWYMTDNPAYSLAIAITISLLAGLLTALKAFRAPGSETLATWVVSFIAALCAIVAVGRFDPLLMAYPLYLFVLYAMFILAILSGRRRIARTLHAPRSELSALRVTSRR